MAAPGYVAPGYGGPSSVQTASKQVIDVSNRSITL